MEIASGPSDVIWDITYACPLRCIHCYSESGRRSTRQLGAPDLFRVADALIAMRPSAIAIAGGEPLAVPDLVDVAKRLSRSGIAVTLYTGGWHLDAGMADALMGAVAQINVSVDGATAEVHDRIRGRAGSFDRAVEALTLLDEAVRRRLAAGLPAPVLGIDCAVVRGNFHQIDDLCTAVARRFPRLGFLWFGAAVPSGLASRADFAVHELVTDAQHRQLGSPEQLARIRSLAPRSVAVASNDNLMLMMRPDLVARGVYMPALQVEPDGEVRAMPIYEGTVGNVLTEPPDVLWDRAVQRWGDPFVVEALTPVRTMVQWADAARRIDYHFGTDATRARIDRRPAFAPS
ncbi:radical SAM protein [Actinoplanes sp. NPDC049681]|uniref:radical SAM protein n=1 Tax=Actinoplanes sp. NPDC049681 TaxID=3363905 RepID=UPI0037B53756